MKKILALGGAPLKIKEARDLLFEIIDDLEMVCLNGGALFHDFQMALDGFTSVPLEELNISMERIEKSALYTALWVKGEVMAPYNSFVRKLIGRGIPVFLFTGLACDYWQYYLHDWQVLARRSEREFYILHNRFKDAPFHFINMCSAVVMPEVFQKCIQGIPREHITADVCDFLEMYRPRTRVAKYGTYYKMNIVEYLENWVKEIENGRFKQM